MRQQQQQKSTKHRHGLSVWKINAGLESSMSHKKHQYPLIKLHLSASQLRQCYVLIVVLHDDKEHMEEKERKTFKNTEKKIRPNQYQFTAALIQFPHF